MQLDTEKRANNQHSCTIKLNAFNPHDVHDYFYTLLLWMWKWMCYIFYNMRTKNFTRSASSCVEWWNCSVSDLGFEQSEKISKKFKNKSEK